MEIRVKPQTLEDFRYGRKFVRGLASRSIASVMLLEAFVEAGRTYQAYKRGGFTEARERFTEEFIGGVFWFSGVPLFNSLIDKYVGKKVFNLKETNFDTHKDSLRNPIKNYISKFQDHLKKNPKDIEKMIAKYKFGKVVASILLANGLVGLVLPKVNQGITKHILKKNTEKNQKTDNSIKNTQREYTLDKFVQKSRDKKDVSFGALSPEMLMSLAYNFENNPKYGLIATDMGVWIGRGACARNKYERREVLFRDISSSYFYMFNMPFIAMMLNKIQTGQKTRLDPVAAEQVTRHLDTVLNAHGGTMKANAFRQFVFGNPDNKLMTESIKNALQEGKGVMELDKFKELLGDIKAKDVDIEKLSKTAEKMSKLQPKIVGKAMLSEKQILDVFSGGAINMPEFLENIFKCATSDQNLFTGKISEPGYDKEFVFISQETFTKKQKEIKQYVESIIKKAKDGEITKDLLKKANRENYFKNALNWGIGFAISAAFLSTFIPKIQYWLTKKATGSNEFPGTADYSKKK